MQKEAILKNATALATQLRSEVDTIESIRRLPDDVVSALKKAGCFRMAMPRDWGGPEMTSLEQHNVIFELSRANASVGWCVMIGLDSGILSGYLQESVARKIYGELDVVQAGWLYPAGQAHRVPGGYEVSGHWRFGSGCTHCDVLDAGCTVYADGKPVMNDGVPEWRVMLAPRDSYEILDTWYTTGLCGSGSNDYRVDKLFVPEEHTFSFSEPVRQGPLWHAPDVILRKMSAIPLGIARDALDQVLVMLESKTEKPSQRLLKETPRVQSLIAELEGRYGMADAYVRQVLDSLWELGERGDALSVQDRSHAWLSRTQAFQTSRDIVAALYDLMGASSVYVRESPLDRHFRDIQTICQHMVGQTKEYERVGELMLTGKSSTLML